MNARLEAALSYAGRGWHVLPLANKGKWPLTRHGKDDATTDSQLIRGWWREWSTANIGLACRASGFVALDVDPRNGGDDSLWTFEQFYGDLPETLRVLSGGGGIHLLFAHPEVPVVGELAPGLEVKDRGYIVAPPSVHPNGRRYEWDCEEGEDQPLATLPAAWLERVREKAPVQPRRNSGSSDDELKRIPTATYLDKLAGRTVNARGFAQCPFHKGGVERTPSLKAYGDGTWACFGCPKPSGRRALGGDIFTFAGLLTGLAEFPELKAWIEERLA